MPQVVLPQKNRRLDNHLVGASLRILLETKRMNVVALGRWGHFESRQMFLLKRTKSLTTLEKKRCSKKQVGRRICKI